MRKIHNQESGYVAERRNPLAALIGPLPPGTRNKVVIYRAAEQGIDAGGNKYAVVCDAHGQIGGATSVPHARKLMKDPSEFCTKCRDLTPVPLPPDGK